MAKDTKFKPGQSGNPAGKPKGAKDKRTYHRELFQAHADELIKKAVEMAKAGDPTMLKACLDRIVSPYRAIDPPVKIEGIEGSLSAKGEQVIAAALRDGILSASEASCLLTALAAQARIIEVDELERRIRRLEGNRNAN